jgi:murein DD-endopeptidase MepM/ murein hydrolase activator NlpD
MVAKATEKREILERIWKIGEKEKGRHYRGTPKEPAEDSDRGGQPDGSHKEVFQWPLKKFVITQEYGCTSFARCGNPKGAYGGKPHNGIDISSRPDQSGFLDLRMRAVMAGKVIMVAPESLSGGWGNAVVISHPNGLFTLYGHLSRAIVKEGQKVKKGQLIGFEGSTGFSTGRHLHFSVYMEITIYRTKWYYGPGYDFEYTLDPMIFLPKR